MAGGTLQDLWIPWITLREHSLLWMCSCAALLDFWWVEFPLWSPGCLPSPRRAHGLVFFGRSPEQVLAFHCSGLFVVLAAITLSSSGIWKLSLNKLLSRYSASITYSQKYFWRKAFALFPLVQVVPQSISLLSHSLLFTSPCGCL